MLSEQFSKRYRLRLNIRCLNMVSLSAQFWKRYSVGVKGILKNTAIKYFIREIISLSMSVRPKMAANDLHASDGRDTEALNCKPITNL